jgi:hypothetical protein
MHCISRETLKHDGIAHDVVCALLVTLFSDNLVHASAPSWDGHWLSMLLRAAGRPRHLLRLRDSEEAFVAAARRRLGPEADQAAIAHRVAAARALVDAQPATHRALADARREWRIWVETGSEG